MLMVLPLTLPVRALVDVADEVLNELATDELAVPPLLAAAAPATSAVASPELLFWPELSRLLSLVLEVVLLVVDVSLLSTCMVRVSDWLLVWLLLLVVVLFVTRLSELSTWLLEVVVLVRWLLSVCVLVFVLLFVAVLLLSVWLLLVLVATLLLFAWLLSVFVVLVVAVLLLLLESVSVLLSVLVVLVIVDVWVLPPRTSFTVFSWAWAMLKARAIAVARIVRFIIAPLISRFKFPEVS